MKVFAVKPSPSGTPRLRLCPRLVEKVLVGGVTRLNVPIRHAGPVRSDSPTLYQVIEGHRYYQGQIRGEERRVVSFGPSGDCFLTATPAEVRREGRGAGEVIQAPSETVSGATQGRNRPPSDLREWSTRLWLTVRSASRKDLHDLTPLEQARSGGYVRSLPSHPGSEKSRRLIFRALWDRAWKNSRLGWEKNPPVLSLDVQAERGLSSPSCVSPSRARGGPEGPPIGSEQVSPRRARKVR